MIKLSKRMKETNAQVDEKKSYPLAEAVSRLNKFPKVKFDETVELHFHLNIDTANTDQLLRGTVLLPHGTGKKIKIAVFCKGEQVQKAQEAGADYVGGTDLIEKVANGMMDFDSVIASPDMMRDLSKLGKVLGPRGLMPSPKAGSVTTDIERVIKELRAGKIIFKADKQGGVHVGIGKRSFSNEQIVENANQLIEAINHARPAYVKGNLIKSLSLSSTMGAGIKVAV